MLEDRLIPKIKKRMKEEDLGKKLIGKVNQIEFHKMQERMDNNINSLADRVDYRLPAMEYEFKRDL